jgi:hypothetical protein
MAAPVTVRRGNRPEGTAQVERPPATVSPAPTSRPAVALFYAINILLSAFLLFQVELMMGKFVLPRYGGGPSVWSTALLVFQVLLLCGYAYAAFVSWKFPPNQQARAHLGLIGICALLTLLQALFWHGPLFPRISWLSGGSEYPVLQISTLLLLGAGVPCILLSANSPLFQNWFASSSQASPYRLYAVSNLGSLLGLISYPFFVERKFTLTAQAWGWSGLFALVLICSAIGSFWRMREPVGAKPEPARKTRKKVSVPAHEPRLWWLVLAGCSCTMLLATTNMICQQVAPVPLLWVLPLGLYLLSFVICFDHPRWYRREIFFSLYVVLAYMALIALPQYNQIRTEQVVLILCAAMFVVCMICHGELARSKPPIEQLTSYYLTIAAGGALGSAFVALLAPVIFDRFWEFHVGLLVCGVLLTVGVLRDRESWVRRKSYGIPIVASVAILLGIGAFYMIDKPLEQEAQAASAVLKRTRNFFGVKAIVQKPTAVGLFHGRTLHGSQSLLPASRNLPLLYYSHPSGVGILLDQFPRSADHPNLRVGIIGMGTGTLAAYAQAGDYYRFYEIDPDVVQFSSGSNPYFTFVKSSPAKIDIVEGDARIRLQAEFSRGESHDFDVLVVDAFSGDSIPVHLLTRQAMELYLQRIRGPQSVIAFHLSNSSLDLRPLMDSLARTYRLASVEIHTPADVDPLWVLLSRDPATLRLPGLVADGKALQVSRQITPWTDDYSSLYQLLVRAY